MRELLKRNALEKAIRWLRLSAYRVRRRLALTFTRGPALFRRMGIPMSTVDPSRRGLVVIQIDGLSHKRMQTALRKRKMRFLSRLVRQRRFKFQKYLSQIPTSTPAFQAGIFYGENRNIPGFQFYDRVQKRHYRMGDTDCAYSVQSSFQNPGLLKDGSVFSCVYSGDAEASLFIFSSLLAPKRWRFALRAWDIFLLTVMNLIMIFRVAMQAVVEMAVGFYDMVKRVARHGHFKREFEIVGIRIGLSVISREIITTGAIIDLFRRVPVVYVNFLAYDEHSHLRGPESRFARWTLRDIDRCIRKIYRAAGISERQYDFFVLSDHGQASVKPFSEITGQSLAEYLQAQLKNVVVENYMYRDPRMEDLSVTAYGVNRMVQSMPALTRPPARMYANYLARELEAEQEGEKLSAILDVSVVSTGPIAYAYWTRSDIPLTKADIETMHPNLLQTLALNPAIACVSVRVDDMTVYIRSANGEAWATADSYRQTGNMPFDVSANKQHVIAGIYRVTTFPRSGDICFWGGYAPAGNVSFSYEFGCHSGYTDDEIEAFVMAPAHVRFDFSRIREHSEFYRFFRRYTLEENQPITKVRMKIMQEVEIA